MSKNILNEKKDNSKKKVGVFSPMVTTTTINLPCKHIGENIKVMLNKILTNTLEGKCNKNGYIKKNSCNIVKYSCGQVVGENIKFSVVYECLICNPVENMVIDCVAKNITKAGIRAEVPGFETSPIVIFIARDHHHNNKAFNNINEDDTIQIKVIGQRFELNDTFISVIGDLVNQPTKKKINIE